MKICMDLGGDIKKRAPEKKILCPPPVAYIMNAALPAYLFTFAVFVTVIIYVQYGFSVGS